MSSAPKSSGLPNALVFGGIAVAVIVFLLCGGVGLYFVFKGGPGSVSKGGKPIDPRDALKTAELFVQDVGREDYNHALKYRSTGSFRRRYNEDSFKEFVEGQGKGLIGATNWHFIKSSDPPDNPMKFVGQLGGGPYGAVRVELSLIDEGEGPRISDLEFKGK